MFISMTGYGRASKSIGDKELLIEIKTVNHKGLDINVRSPQDLIPLEKQIVSYMNKRVQRGRVEIFISFQQSSSNPGNTIDVDKVLAKQYYHSIRKLAGELDISKEMTVGQLITLPGVIKPANNQARVSVSWESFEPILEKAVDDLMEFRKKEGAELQKDIMARAKLIEKNVKKIHKAVPQALKTRQTKLRENVNKLFEDSGIKIDPNQVAAAAITLLDQVDVTEELVRVDSHLAQFHETAESDEMVGRRIDFILQELFREFTTIGSKTNHAEIGKAVVDVKTELDKIKQQIANIE